MAVAPAVEAQYSRGDLRSRIESALQAAGKSAERLQLDDLAQLDEFHLLGRPATLALARLAGISAGDRVLDLGAGLAGRRVSSPTTSAPRSSRLIWPPSTARSPNG